MGTAMPRRPADELFDAVFAAKWAVRQGLDPETGAEEHANAWWAGRPAVAGAAATLAEGFRLAARVFGDLLWEPPRP